MRTFLFVVAIMLFAALFHLPYAYYPILRIVVTLAFVFIALREYDTNGWSGWFIFAVCGAILMNPFIPIRIPKSTWGIINPIQGACIGYYAYAKLSK